MSNAALKIEPLKEEREVLHAFRRAHHTPPTAPLFILESEDIEKLAFKMPAEVPHFPFSFFIDASGHVHFEINYSSYDIPVGFKSGIKKILNPDKFLYDLLRKNIVEGSFLKNERKLIGGGVATYYTETKTIEVKIYGILKPEHCVGIDPYVRKNAFAELTYWLRPLGEWLGAEKIVSSPCVIHPDKMKKIGWEKLKMNFKEWLLFLKASFPLILVRRQNIFICNVYKRFIGNEARTFSAL